MQNNSSDMVQRAEDFARRAHKGQKDDDGEDYFSAHIQVVAEIIKKVTTKSEIIAAAYLHDVIEDTATTRHELIYRFGKRVADLVFELTKVAERGEMDNRFPNLKSKDAMMIKFADRLSNISRMGSWKGYRIKEYLDESAFWKT